jgi:hypothetical protein
MGADSESTHAFAVDSFGVIEGWDVDFAFLDEPVICHHYPSNWGHEDCVGRHEIEECLRIGEDDPGDCPSN